MKHPIRLAAILVPLLLLADNSTSVSATLNKSSEGPRISHRGGEERSAVAVTGKGGELLTISKTSSLENGENITISGSNYDVNIGVYVAECVLVPVGALPTPCISEFSSKWISSNPPPYGIGLAIPYLLHGGFLINAAVVAKSSFSNIDCRMVPCAIYVRADNIHGDDRSFDLAVALNFEARTT